MTRDQCGLLIGALIALGIFGYLQVFKYQTSTPPAEARAAVSSNVANEQFLKQKPAAQADLLAEAIGKGCKGKEAFFMGLDRRKVGLWSLRCADNRAFMVSVYPDRATSPLAVECELLASLKTGRTCFKPLPR